MVATSNIPVVKKFTDVSPSLQQGLFDAVNGLSTSLTLKLITTAKNHRGDSRNVNNLFVVAPRGMPHVAYNSRCSALEGLTCAQEVFDELALGGLYLARTQDVFGRLPADFQIVGRLTKAQRVKLYEGCRTAISAPSSNATPKKASSPRAENSSCSEREDSLSSQLSEGSLATSEDSADGRGAVFDPASTVKGTHVFLDGIIESWDRYGGGLSRVGTSRKHKTYRKTAVRDLRTNRVVVVCEWEDPNEAMQLGGARSGKSKCQFDQLCYGGQYGDRHQLVFVPGRSVMRAEGWEPTDSDNELWDLPSYGRDYEYSETDSDEYDSDEYD